MTGLPRVTKDKDEVATAHLLGFLGPKWEVRATEKAKDRMAGTGGVRSELHVAQGAQANPQEALSVTWGEGWKARSQAGLPRQPPAADLFCPKGDLRPVPQINADKRGSTMGGRGAAGQARRP